MGESHFSLLVYQGLKSDCLSHKPEGSMNYRSSRILKINILYKLLKFTRNKLILLKGESRFCLHCLMLLAIDKC